MILSTEQFISIILLAFLISAPIYTLFWFIKNYLYSISIILKYSNTRYSEIEKELSKHVSKNLKEDANPVEVSLYINKYFIDRLDQYSSKINHAKIFNEYSSFIGISKLFFKSIFIGNFEKLFVDKEEFYKMQNHISRNK